MIPEEIETWYCCLKNKTTIKIEGEKLMSSDKIITIDDYLSLLKLIASMNKQWQKN